MAQSRDGKWQKRWCELGALDESRVAFKTLKHPGQKTPAFSIVDSDVLNVKQSIVSPSAAETYSFQFELHTWDRVYQFGTSSRYSKIIKPFYSSDDLNRWLAALRSLLKDCTISQNEKVAKTIFGVELNVTAQRRQARSLF
jgi:hypothetical protein